jgi:hypothetical protein
MNKSVARLAAATVIGAVVYAPLGAAAEINADKAAVQKATAECKAQIKEYAQYHETSWYQRHKMVKSCIKQALAKK